MLHFLAAGGLEAKWVLAGVLAFGAAAAISSDKKAEARAAEERVAAAPQPAPCTQTCK